MVCLGNICRSPLAEGIMREKLKQRKLEIYVDSAGTSSYHIGENPDRRSITNALKNGVDISKLIARQFKVTDFNGFDVIYAMDKQNMKDILKLSRNSEDAAKVKLLLDELDNTNFNEVPDPYFGGEDGFQLVFDLVNEACEKIAEKLQHEMNNYKL
ncbi:MAG: low molecular weight phosphotyrosine protein phosphatase [Bacteroidia bacterium]|nr:low molecular weight phosphotyrosine protein phosphatase [Bacteroidia bacterium]